ncbi:GNAT family N-acetyltransferase [Flexibacterium corallicola]|uniref:GNAT family N-acetyltransferase n=1 Tax=Flexibacterium corallicola TaxID=3037259 RepID=UPI00286F0B33|nr:GNAT family N-acetyltransferase [Pseudovibrio sp. M1P-2-3]
MIFPELRTQRLHLRRPVEADLPRIRRCFDDFEVAKMTASFIAPLDEEGARKLLERFTKVDLEQDIIWALDDGTGFVGSLGVHGLHGIPSMGYCLGQDYWGRGYMSEAVEAVLAHVFTLPHLKKIYADTFVENPASSTVLRKAGFIQYATTKRRCRARSEKDVPTLRFKLSRQDFIVCQTNPSRLQSADELS